MDEMNLDEQLMALSLQRQLVAEGSRKERLVISGAMLASLAVIAYLLLWSLGITPASKLEREFIDMLRESDFASEPRVAYVLTEIDASVYTSRRDFRLAEAAFTLAAR